MNDLFIRRVYTHKGISVAVDIDLVAKTLSLVEKNGNNFSNKKWVFAQRGLEYMGGWCAILDAMKHAIQEASKELKIAEERDQEKFVELLLAMNKPLKREQK